MKFLILVIVLFAQLARANVDIDIFESKVPDKVVVEITVDGCTSSFKVPKKQWESLANNDSALSDMAEISKQRAKNKCSN